MRARYCRRHLYLTCDRWHGWAVAGGDGVKSRDACRVDNILFGNVFVERGDNGGCAENILQKVAKSGVTCPPKYYLIDIRIPAAASGR